MLSSKTKRSVYFVAVVVLVAVAVITFFNRRTSPIDYFVLEPQDLSETIVTTGHVGSLQALEVAFENAGTIGDVYAKEGDAVKPGDIIMTQNHDLEQAAFSLLQKQLTTAFKTAREKVLQAETEADQKRKELERTEVLAESGAISQTDLEAARNANVLAISNLNLARQELENRTVRTNYTRADPSQDRTASEIQLHQAWLNLEQKKLRSPIEGQILSMEKHRGEYVQPGVIVAKLTTSTPAVIIEMDEKQVFKTKIGQRVLVSPQSDASMIVEASISHIGTIVNTGTGTYTIKCTLESFPGTLKPNSIVNAEIIVSEEKQLLVIPREYLRNGPDGPEIILWNNGNPTITTAGILKSFNNYVVIAGLQKGTTLIHPAQFQSGIRYRLGSTKGSE